MKNLFIIMIFTLFSSININAHCPKTNQIEESKSSTFETLWTVTVTFSVYNEYYLDQYYREHTATGPKSIQTQEFTIRAETANQAEEAAKSQCSTTCSYDGQPLGQVTYGGKLLYAKECRIIENARATPRKGNINY